MTQLLRIDVSPRGADSHSRQIGDRIETALMAKDTVRRNLAAMPVQHLDGAAITGFFSPQAALTNDLRQATALSDAIIAEVEAADTLLITTPMFNFGVPSVLKAWIDQLVRINRTFSFDGANFDGLLKGKRAVVVIAYGAAGYADGGALAGADFVRPFMDFVLRFVGFSSVEFVTIEATNADPESRARAQAECDAQITELLRGPFAIAA
jgi:FMN-dependent NADH-azoreductase